jgi:membrane fusion protein, multidrug efflux system
MKSSSLFIAIATVIMLSACAAKKDNASLEAKKATLADLQKKQDALTTQIIKLQQEIDALDETAVASKVGKLVSTIAIETQPFRHYLEMQGTATSKENVLILPEASGVVKQILVSEGQAVSKGQTLMIIDDEMIAKQIEEVKTQYDLLKIIFEKQKSLWDQNIGSEVQYLEAKNRKESTEKSLERLNSQLEKTRVKSPINGTVDEIMVNTGELAGPSRQVIRVINLDEVFIHADASENYIGSVRKGDSVVISFPAINVVKRATISAVGQVINPTSRTFGVDVKLQNNDKTLKANLLSIIKVADYQNEKALTVPTKWIQQDHGQDIIYVSVNDNGKNVAQKRIMKKGKSYNGVTEVLEGINAGEVLITEGSRDVTDGEIVRSN